MSKNSRGKNTEEKSEKKENGKKEEQKKDDIVDFGQITLDQSSRPKIHLLTIIGEIEGHELLPSGSKTTKYEHVIPSLAAIEDDDSIGGLLVIINTVGGDVESGLAIAEMIASLGKPKVSLVIGGSHSIGVPLAVAADYSFIVPTGTMLIHPVRMSGTVIGARQTYEYFQRMQDRITGFIEAHSNATQEEVEDMMVDTGYLTKDLGTILTGEEAVEAGIIDAVGGICEALKKLRGMIDKTNRVSGKH